MQDIAIIGAGVAGMAAAYELTKAGYRVVVFEKSRGVSGRAATRRREGLHFDHGANFFRTDDPEVDSLVHQVLPTDELIEIAGDVCTFDGDSRIKRGDPAQNARPKYSYRAGISTLGKLLRQEAAVEVRTQVRIHSLAREGGAWLLLAEGGESLGIFSRVVITAPAPQAARILEASSVDADYREEVISSLLQVPYRPQFSFILGYSSRIERPLDCYALVNEDGQHAVSWLSFEEDKAGHVPEGESVLIVQMATAWSAARLEESREKLLAEVLTEARKLVPKLPEEPAWWDSQRWMLARPEGVLQGEGLRLAEAAGLFFSGDGTTGKARISMALRSGLETARAIIADDVR
ncbi:MAG: FAD-dependent oxidoreductase [Verrucomicrobiota bacterium JB023]|nr:FAD-dependent oxidoreductase [Verrucomicrobiota bacterium JB023]